MKPYGFIGRKAGMTRIPDGGRLSSVTLIRLEEQKITKVLTKDKDGYDAIQVGYFAKKDKALTKADHARLRRVEITDNFSRFREFRTAEPVPADSLGVSLHIDMLQDVKMLDVQGIVKGRGFQGAIKRWGYKTGRRTHGSRFHRRPGSLGCRTSPGRVFKNKRMPGHMGSTQQTIQNLQVMGIDSEQQVVAVKGAVPGNRGGYVVLKPAVKMRL